MSNVKIFKTNNPIAERAAPSHDKSGSEVLYTFNGLTPPSESDIADDIAARRAVRRAERGEAVDGTERRRGNRIAKAALLGAGAVTALSAGGEHLLDAGQAVVEHVTSDPNVGPEPPTSEQQERMRETLGNVNAEPIEVTQVDASNYHVDVRHPAE